MKILKMKLMECTLPGESSANRKRTENLINQLLRRVVVQVGGGECEICAIVFFFECLLNFNCQLKLLKLEGTR